jgi:hypothetical protein
MWSIIGGSAALILDIVQDWALLFSGALTLTILIRSKMRPSQFSGEEDLSHQRR